MVAASEPVPHFASGIGSLAAVRQVTVTPEVGGRVTEIDFDFGAKVKAGDKIIQINDAPDRGDLANFQAQARSPRSTLARAQTLASHQYGTQDRCRPAQSQLDQANAQIQKTQAIIAQKDIRAPFGGQLGVRQVDLGQYLNPGAPVVTLTDLRRFTSISRCRSQMAPQIAVGQKVDVTADAFPGPQIHRDDHHDRAADLAPTRARSASRRRCPTRTRRCCRGCSSTPRWCCPTDAPQVVLPETAVDYTLYGDSVYVIRADGNDANGKPVLKAHRTPVKTGLRWDNKVAVLDGLKAGRPGRRRRPDQGAGRRRGHRHRQSAAAAARKADTAMSVAAAALESRFIRSIR